MLLSEPLHVKVVVLTVVVNLELEQVEQVVVELVVVLNSKVVVNPNAHQSIGLNLAESTDR